MARQVKHMKATPEELRERHSERQRRRRGIGHSRHTEEAEYGIEAGRRRKLARIAEMLQIVTAYHASDRKIPRPACIPDPDKP